jgi:protein-disulfide isomerase
VAGGAWIFLAFLIVFILAIAYGYYSRKGDITARQDRTGNVNVGKDVQADVRTWGRGSSTSRPRRRRSMTPVEQRTAEAIGDPAWRARIGENVQLVAPVDPARDHIRGPHDAPVTLVEYGEYECRYCKDADVVVARAQERLGDAVRLVFRHFPQRAVHPNAQDAAVAAEAAGRQGRFWELHAALAHTKKPLERDVVLALAQKVDGLDMDRFAADLDDPGLRARVEDDLRTGLESGVNGTPTFFLNNVRYDDDVEDEDELVAALEAARDAASSTASMRSA